jgi:WD40 repeat protein
MEHPLPAPISSLVLDREGRLIVACLQDKTAVLCSLGSSGELVSSKVFAGHKDVVTSAAFSPKERSLLVTGSLDKTGSLVNEHVIIPLSLYSCQLILVCVSIGCSSSTQKGRVSTLMSFAAKLWNLETGASQGTLRGHGSGVTHVVFSADGSMIYTSSLDTNVIIWCVMLLRSSNNAENHAFCLFPWMGVPLALILGLFSHSFSVQSAFVLNGLHAGAHWDMRTGAGHRASF